MIFSLLKIPKLFLKLWFFIYTMLFSFSFFSHGWEFINLPQRDTPGRRISSGRLVLTHSALQPDTAEGCMCILIHLAPNHLLIAAVHCVLKILRDAAHTLLRLYLVKFIAKRGWKDCHPVGVLTGSRPHHEVWSSDVWADTCSGEGSELDDGEATEAQECTAYRKMSEANPGTESREVKGMRAGKRGTSFLQGIQHSAATPFSWKPTSLLGLP